MTAEPTGADPLLVETVERLFAATSTFEAIERSEADRWCAPVWQGVADAGLPWVSLPEPAGGSGGSLFDVAAILRSAGAHAAPIPLAETGVLGGWLLVAAGWDLPSGPVTVVPDPTVLSIVNGRLVGTATVAWAERAERILAIVDSSIISVRPAQTSITPGANLAGEPRDTVTFDVPITELDRAAAPAGVDGEALVRRGSFSRIVMAAGALSAMAQLTVDYTSARRQFGKPVAAFQAVQQHLVTAAQCSVKASMAADLATVAMAHDRGGIELAAARVVVDQASVLATRAAHQAHGAMGVTREYALHHLSRRLWAWRHEFRSGTTWQRDLGRTAVGAGADGLFPLITA